GRERPGGERAAERERQRASGDGDRRPDGGRRGAALERCRQPSEPVRERRSWTDAHADGACRRAARDLREAEDESSRLEAHRAEGRSSTRGRRSGGVPVTSFHTLGASSMRSLVSRALGVVLALVLVSAPLGRAAAQPAPAAASGAPSPEAVARAEALF